MYDVPQEGMTRMQSLQSQLTTLSDEHKKLKDLFEALRRGNDQESTTLLAKLRMGDSIDNLLSYLGQDEQSLSSGYDQSQVTPFIIPQTPYQGLHDGDARLNNANVQVDREQHGHLQAHNQAPSIPLVGQQAQQRRTAIGLHLVNQAAALHRKRLFLDYKQYFHHPTPDCPIERKPLLMAITLHDHLKMRNNRTKALTSVQWNGKLSKKPVMSALTILVLPLVIRQEGNIRRMQTVDISKRHRTS